MSDNTANAGDVERLLLTVSETAKVLGVGRNKVYELVAGGEIPALRLGRTIRIPRLGLEQWISSAAGLPAAPPKVVDWPPQPSQRH